MTIKYGFTADDGFAVIDTDARCYLFGYPTSTIWLYAKKEGPAAAAARWCRDLNALAGSSRPVDAERADGGGLNGIMAELVNPGTLIPVKAYIVDQHSGALVPDRDCDVSEVISPADPAYAETVEYLDRFGHYTIGTPPDAVVHLIRAEPIRAEPQQRRYVARDVEPPHRPGLDAMYALRRGE